MINKLKLVNYYISISDDKLDFTPIYDTENKDLGFEFYTFENNDYHLFLQASNIQELKIHDFVLMFGKNNIESFNKIYTFFKEIFQLYIWDKKKLVLHSITDFLGVGTNYHYNGDRRNVFFSNFIKTDILGTPLEIVPEYLYDYLAIGYQIKPFKLPFKNIDTHKGCTLYSYSKNKVHITLIKPVSVPVKNVENILIDSVSKTAKYRFLGATSGKDSLALISLLKNNEHTILGSFGNPESADVLQGNEIAKDMAITYKHQNYASSQEFKEFSENIAQISGGLTTSSYIDMLCFVAKSIPKDYTFIMGEGGECVRMFFESFKNIEQSLDNYITPIEYLNSTLNLKRENHNFKELLTEQILSEYKGHNTEETLLNFYRQGRMPGNFSNRHKIISVYRSKYSPFLDYDFIKNTYDLDRKNYKNSNLHKQIVVSQNQELVKWFDKPIESKFSPQDFEERFKGYIGKIIRDIFTNMSKTSQLYFNKLELIKILDNQLNSADRGMYYLLRVISFIIFIDSNQHCFKSNK
jgi:hypothetical protein